VRQIPNNTIRRNLEDLLLGIEADPVGAHVTPESALTVLTWVRRVSKPLPKAPRAGY